MNTMEKPGGMRDNPRKALGKGLGALLPTRAVSAPPPPAAVENAATGESAEAVPISAIVPNPFQPRRFFEPQRIEELAQSIRVNGIIQPLVVRKDGIGYQLVAGERRLRAAKAAGLERVPVIVREFPDDRLLEVTLIENIQREDLNPIDTAHAFERMANELSLSPEEIGRRTGKDRSTVVNTLRLLQLPEDIRDLVSQHRLSAGHARSILALPTPEMQRELAEKAVAQGWSVRQTERAVQKLQNSAAKLPEEIEEALQDPNVRAAIQEMQRVLGTRVRIIEKARKGGRIEIEYYSAEDLDRIYGAIVGEQ